MRTPVEAEWLGLLGFPAARLFVYPPDALEAGIEGHLTGGVTARDEVCDISGLTAPLQTLEQLHNKIGDPVLNAHSDRL